MPYAVAPHQSNEQLSLEIKLITAVKQSRNDRLSAIAKPHGANDLLATALSWWYNIHVPTDRQHLSADIYMSTKGQRVITVRSVQFGYDSSDSVGGLTVFKGLDMKVPTGTFASILGPSGCGKSTLLMLIAGLLRPANGTIDLDHTSPDQARLDNQIGLVPQKPVFLGWRSVLANARLSAEIGRLDAPNAKAGELLDAFQLSEFREAYPHELSGGMLSRVALARALAHAPRYLLLDEAFNNLDEVLREKVYLYLERVWLKDRPTIVSVTHTLSEAVLFSDCIFLLSQRPGRVVENFPIDLPRPRDPEMLNTPEARTLIETIRLRLHDVWHTA